MNRRRNESSISEKPLQSILGNEISINLVQSLSERMPSFINPTLMSSKQAKSTTSRSLTPTLSTMANIEPVRVRTDSTASSIYVMVGGNKEHKHLQKLPTMSQNNRIQMRHCYVEDEVCESTATITPSPQTTRSYVSHVSTVSTTEIMNQNDERQTVHEDGRRKTSTIDESGISSSSTSGTCNVGGINHVAINNEYLHTARGNGNTNSNSNSNSNGSDGVGDVGGNISGRTTATSGCMSSSGIATISGSNSNLNEIRSAIYAPNVLTSNTNKIETSSYTVGTDVSNSKLQSLPPNESFNVTNGSTVKLIVVNDDDSNKQVSFH